MEHEGDNYTNSDWCFWYSYQRIIKGTGGHGNWRARGDDPNYYIIENGQNTCCHSNSSERPSAIADVRNSQGVNNNTNCNWCSWYSHPRIGKRTGRLGNKRTSGGHPNYYIIEIGKNTEKSPGHSWRLAVT